MNGADWDEATWPATPRGSGRVRREVPRYKSEIIHPTSCSKTRTTNSEAELRAGFAVPLPSSDFERDPARSASFVHPPLLFTLEQHVILHSLGRVTAENFDDVLLFRAPACTRRCAGKHHAAFLDPQTNDDSGWGWAIGTPTDLPPRVVGAERCGPPSVG